MKKISIVVPVYNGEKIIEKCIKSLVNQTLEGIEILLINDGSKDNTDQICKKLSIEYNNIKYFKIENSGCSFARNFGIKKASGEYITFVDSDDWVDRNMYFQMYQEVKNLNCDILICGYDTINEKDDVIAKILPKLKNENDYIELDSNWFNSPWNKVYKRNLIISNNIEFLENCHMGEDMVFNFRVFKVAKKISILKKSYYKYFLNENSVSLNPNKRIEIFSAIKEIKKNGVDFKKLDKCIRQHGVICCFGTIESIKENEGDWKKYYNQFLKELNYLKKDMSFKTKLLLLYRKLRLRFVFFKKYLKFFKRVIKSSI